MVCIALLSVVTTAVPMELRAATRGNDALYLDPKAPLEERVKNALKRMTLHEKVMVLHAQSKFTSAGVPRLGIRQLNMDDGPHGVREELEWNTWNVAGWTNDSIVAFPSLTCLAATWNRDLAALYGHSVSEEFAFRGKDVMLGPGVNIARTPMNGRAFEYMGEDPMLAAEMVVPYIRAAQQNGVACCLKHFVLNDQETDRFSVNVNVSERALREIYLYPFWRAVEKAHVWSIMGSYNYYKGVHCCHNDELLNGILKKEWQWDGALVSDWGGATDGWQAATGGLDIEMGTYTDGKVREAPFGYNDYFLADRFEKLIREGRLPVAVLDEKVSRVLRLIFRTAMNQDKVIGSQCSEAHYEACRQIAEEGIVLLKNGKRGSKAGAGFLLPLDLAQYERILVVGENATRSLTKGGGSSELKSLRDITPLEAIRAAASRQSGNRVGESVDFAQGYTSGRALYDHVDKVDAEENARLREKALQKARQADLIIFVGGLNKNHRQDCENGDRESYDLPFGQSGLIAEMANICQQRRSGAKGASCPRLVVVTFGGNPFAAPWLQQADAFLHCWYLGSEAGTAVADVITGKACPSGKLPVTFARRYEDYPYVRFGERAYPGITGVEVEPNSAGEKPRRQVYYDEDVFVGYRGFERDKTEPLFPFGFGLSYTTFKYDEPAVSVDGDSVIVTLAVTNTGTFAGKETAQLYVSAPKNKRVAKPLKELKGFAKTRLLKPGESQQLRMAVGRRDLAHWDEAARQWQTDGGTYIFQVGASSADIRGRQRVEL